MHSWKKKLVVSQLALACTLAITSQANAANYDTWGYHDNTTTDLVWPYDTDNDGIADVKWFTEFGHLNRGDMLTSEQHRCHNEKKKFQRRV